MAASTTKTGLFAEALAHHQSGRLSDAERLYRNVLALEPSHADSLHLLGVIAGQTQRHDLAIDLINQAIAINGNAAPYHANLGNVLVDQGRADAAIACYRRAVALKPDYAGAHNSLATVLHDRGELEEAVACYFRAIALAPNNADMHNRLGIALQAQGRLDEAIVHFSRAEGLKPDFSGASNNLGNTLQHRGQLDHAVAAYRRAISHRPDYPEAYNNLGFTLQNQGRFDDAIAAHKTALAQGGDPCASYFGLSRCRKFTPADRAMVATMEALLKAPNSPEAGRSLLHFALGKIFDDLGDYETAIGHFDEANRLVRGTRGFDGPQFAAQVDRLIASFPGNEPRTPVNSDFELPVFIVGMVRSGTTLVEQILASHPQVAAGGELEFWLERLGGIFGEWKTGLPPEAEQEAKRDYLAILRGISTDAARVTDKMPNNFLFLGHLRRLFPGARIIHCRRNPVDTALSIYFTRFAQMLDFTYSRADIVSYYRQYLRLMAHWRTMLPPGQFIEIDYEDLVADQEAASRRLIEFCGLEWDAACLDFHKTDHPISTASAWQARQPLYRTSTERWRHYAPWLGEFRELLPPDISRNDAR
jgi:tetratricopeptide (TPR) repeat protein